MGIPIPAMEFVSGGGVALAHTADLVWSLVALVVALAAISYIWEASRSRRRRKRSESAAQLAVQPARTEENGFEIITPDAVQSHPVSLADVAGIDEVKGEVLELIDFLKNPDPYTRLGARMPRGYILYGPPGTGKTLIARAVATECGAAFLHASGSSFVNKFVGVGAARVRSFFETARRHAPVVAFIDEIDAMGRERSGGGNQEYDHCLNELLVQMDGFRQNDRMVLIAATNNYPVLDHALLRPGRFDRHIAIPLPDAAGRRAIFDVHCRNKTLAFDVDLDTLAGLTFGFTGAQIENIANEAAISAARRRDESIHHADFLEGLERVAVGIRQSRRMTPEVRRLIAAHEAGHAIMGYLGGRVPNKITLLPRGQALGYVMSGRQTDDPLEQEAELYGELQQMLGGRAAEEVYGGTRTSGAAADLEQASNVVRQMVYSFGMGKRLIQSKTQDVELERNADEILRHVLGRTKEIMAGYQSVLMSLTDRLLDVETMDRSEFEAFMKRELRRLGLASKVSVEPLVA